MTQRLRVFLLARMEDSRVLRVLYGANLNGKLQCIAKYLLTKLDTFLNDVFKEEDRAAWLSNSAHNLIIKQ